jgi:hypothetical protein
MRNGPVYFRLGKKRSNFKNDLRPHAPQQMAPGSIPKSAASHDVATT